MAQSQWRLARWVNIARLAARTWHESPDSALMVACTALEVLIIHTIYNYQPWQIKGSLLFGWLSRTLWKLSEFDTEDVYRSMSIGSVWSNSWSYIGYDRFLCKLHEFFAIKILTIVFLSSATIKVRDCSFCPAGKYGGQPGLIQETCSGRCPKGFYSNVVGLTSVGQCKKCITGYRGWQCNSWTSFPPRPGMENVLVGMGDKPQPPDRILEWEKRVS